MDAGSNLGNFEKFLTIIIHSAIHFLHEMHFAAKYLLFSVSYLILVVHAKNVGRTGCLDFLALDNECYFLNF